MFPVVQKQADIYGALLCYPGLQSVNVQNFRKWVLAKQINLATLYQTVRGGRVGAGVLVEMPKAVCPRPNVEGPVIDWIYPVLVAENPTVNFQNTNGTQITAEQIVQMVLDCVHLLADDFTGTLSADVGCVVPTTEIEECLAYRVNFKIVGKTRQTQRTKNVAITFSTGMATITCPDAANIYYTTDFSFPVNTTMVGGSTAQLYTAPFAVATGTVVRAVAYGSLMNNSAVAHAIAP